MNNRRAITPEPESKPGSAEGELFFRALLISSAFLSEHPSLGVSWLKIRPGPEAGFIRNCAIYLANTELGLTMTVIGRVLGLERTGIGAAAQAIEDLREDREFDALLGAMGLALRQAHAVSNVLPSVFADLQKKISTASHEKNGRNRSMSAGLVGDRVPRGAPMAQSIPGDQVARIPTDSKPSSIP